MREGVVKTPPKCLNTPKWVSHTFKIEEVVEIQIAGGETRIKVLRDPRAGLNMYCENKTNSEHQRFAS